MIQATVPARITQRTFTEEQRDELLRLSESQKAYMPVSEPRIPERGMLVTPPQTQYTRPTLMKSRIVEVLVTRIVEISVQL